MSAKKVISTLADLYSVSHDTLEDPNELSDNPYFQAVGHIISELSDRQNELATLLNKACDYALTGCIIFNKDGKVIKANQLFCDYIGYTVEEVAGTYFYDYISPESEVEARNTLEGNMDKNEDMTHPMVNTYIHKSERPVVLMWGRAANSGLRDIGIVSVIKG